MSFRWLQKSPQTHEMLEFGRTGNHKWCSDRNFLPSQRRGTESDFLKSSLIISQVEPISTGDQGSIISCWAALCIWKYFKLTCQEHGIIEACKRQMQKLCLDLALEKVVRPHHRISASTSLPGMILWDAPASRKRVPNTLDWTALLVSS